MKRLFGARETMEEVVASKDGKRLAELIKETIFHSHLLLQDSVAALTAEATTVLESSSPSTAIVATASSPAEATARTAAEPQKETCLLESAQAWSEREEGLLYPLSVGLVFLPKPAIFVPAEDILEFRRSDVKPLLAYISDLVSQYQQRAPRDGTALDQDSWAMGTTQCVGSGMRSGYGAIWSIMEHPSASSTFPLALTLWEEENDSDYEDEGDVSAPPVHD
eukprot:Skav209268  [mRNA]  locus=scaffold1552:145022:149884:+ [translate_table: standard]